MKNVLYSNAISNLPECKYNEMKKEKGLKILDDVQSIEFLVEELGFDATKIKIIHTSHMFKMDGFLREILNTCQRNPLYSDWNCCYLRFQVCERNYEFVNGVLYLMKK